MTKPPNDLSASERLVQELTIATDASIGIIAIRCAETEVYRVVDEIYALAQSSRVEFQLHTSETGWGRFAKIDPDDRRAQPFDPLSPQTTDKGTAEILKAFQKLSEEGIPDDGFFVMLDVYFTFGIQVTQTCIRKQAQRAIANGQRLFLIVPNHAEIPDGIAPLMHVIHFGYPTREELSESLDSILESIDKNERPVLTAEERNNIVANGQGMTAHAFETAVALSITDYGARNETEDEDSDGNKIRRGTLQGYGADDIVRMIREYKVQLLRKTNVLELQPTVEESQIGGLDLFKGWMRQRRSTYLPEAREHNITPSRGALVVGPPGCKAEGTVLHYRRGKRNSSRAIRIEDFVAKFNGQPVARSKPWNTLEPTYVQSWDAETGAIFYNEVIAALETGRKHVIKISTDDDEISLTSDDSVLISDGTFKRAGDVRPGDTLLVRGSMKSRSSGGRNVNRPRVVVDGLKFYDSGWSKTVETVGGDYLYKRQHRARLVIEARMNGLTYDEYLHNLKNVPDHPYRATLPSSYDVHHLDENPLNDNIGNLEVLHCSAHLARHRLQSITNLNVEYTKEAVVRKVGKPKLTHTYDLQLSAPCANFVVNNGIVAHNTGKSLVAKAAGSILGLPVIRFDVGRVFGSYIGQSEQSMRTVLAMLDAMAPVVLMLDEIDKGFSGMSGGGGNDSGTTARVFGTFLTWMQERDQVNRPVFLIMTANRVEGLPPELLRKGRVDEIWSVNQPNGSERAQIISIHAKKRNQKIDKADMPSLVRITEGLVGAEIEALIEDALVMSFSEGNPVINYDSLEKAKTFLKPMSLTRATEFEHMRAWAEKNARPASSPDDMETASPPRHTGPKARPIRKPARITRNN